MKGVGIDEADLHKGKLLLILRFGKGGSSKIPYKTKVMVIDVRPPPPSPLCLVHNDGKRKQLSAFERKLGSSFCLFVSREKIYSVEQVQLLLW